MKKVVLLALSTLLFLGSCEQNSNSAAEKQSTAHNKVAKESKAVKEPNQIQWEIDHPKMLAFIKANGIETKWLNSGLYYSIIKPGSGSTPALNSVVNVTYTLSDLDDNKIWSTAQSNGSETRSLSQFPAGVSEGLQLIKEGGHIKLIVPSGLAYGTGGWGKQIAPNTNLYYDIHLNSIQ